jgi:hypothetical protein
MLMLPYLPRTVNSQLDLYNSAPGTIHRILLVAVQEWNYFGGHFEDRGKTLRKGHGETETGYDKKVGEYWKVGTGQNLDGDDTGWAWSATFISYVMRKAGVSDRDFRRSIRHSEYIHFALKNRLAFGAKFVGRRLTEYRPKEGDLICNSRAGAGITFDKAVTRDSYKSHCDIVVYVRPDEIGVIGGNVGPEADGKQTVGLRTWKLNAGGYLSDKSKAFFAILENKLPLK